MSDTSGTIGDLPARPAQRPGLPENAETLVFERFDGLNTKPLRPGIADGEMALCDGFMPLGPSNLRTLYGVGPTLYTATAPVSIVWHQGCNLGDHPGHLVVLSDGTVIFINDTTGIITTVLSTGTILSPSTIFGFSQWATPIPMLIMAKDQDNGYWLYDGTNKFTAGTVSPEIIITNGGKNYNSQPTVHVFTTGAGINAGYAATIQDGSVVLITASQPGTGFAADDLMTLYITGGGSDDSAIGSPTISASTVGGIDEVFVNIGGSGYTGATKIIATGGGGADASFAATIVAGVITAVSVINAGHDYTSAPTITADDPGIGSGSSHIAGGTGFSGFCNIAGGQITGGTVISGGTGYVAPPTVTVIGDGQGAQVVANISAGAVTSFLIKERGKGYTKALFVISGGNNSASATTQIMPFGVSGTTIEVYNNQVWIANGSASSTFPPKNRIIFSAPGSASNFDPTAGGGAFTSNNAQLRVGYHTLKQINGFLYLIGDSALDAISGVQSSTASTGVITTTFNVVGIDPQIGTPWPSSIQSLNRDLILANTLGIFVSYGGAITKISEQLDGFYASGSIFGITSNFSSAVAQIFGRYVYMLLLPIVDPFTGVGVTKLLMWDGKRWWTSSQEKSLTYVSTQEINSVMTAWGTDGSTLFQLFTSPSTTFTKRVQSKLWATPGYETTKQTMHLLGLVNFYRVDSPISVYIDTESASSINTNNIISGAIIWTNNAGASIAWSNNASQPITWNAVALIAFGPYPVGQVGRLSGLTIQTNAADIAVLSMKLYNQVTTLMP